MLQNVEITLYEYPHQLQEIEQTGKIRVRPYKTVVSSMPQSKSPILISTYSSSTLTTKKYCLLGLMDL